MRSDYVAERSEEVTLGQYKATIPHISRANR
jgi:hypothetical protein